MIKKKTSIIIELFLPFLLTFLLFLIDSKFFSEIKQINIRELIYVFFIGGVFSLILSILFSVNEMKNSLSASSNEIKQLQTEISELNANLTKGIRKIENDNIYPFSIHLLQNEPNNKTVFIFKSYNQKTGTDDEFLKECIREVNSGKIGKYYRIMIVNNEVDRVKINKMVDDHFTSIKEFQKSKVHLYRIEDNCCSNYISYLVLNDHILITFPDVDNVEIIGHKYALYLQDQGIASSLKNRFLSKCDENCRILV
jgi:hypothetical protein